MKVKYDELIYGDLLDSENCNVYYIFNDNDKLESGLYLFTKKYSNLQFYAEDYEKFKALLNDKYGKAVSDTENRNKSFTDTDKQNIGQAVADGNLTLATIWQTNRSIIKLALVNGKDKQPVLEIHYTTRSLQELENQDELKATISKL